MSENTIIKCKNCGNEFSGIFCNKCGQKYINERITVKYILTNTFVSIFNINKGFIYTAKMLFINPDTVINDYINGKTKDYANPIKYLLILTGLSSFLYIYFNVFDAQQDAIYGVVSDSSQNKLQFFIREKIKTYLNFISLILLPFMSLSSFVIYKRIKYYYAEHLIINSYFFAQITFLSLAFFPILLIYKDLITVYTYANFIFAIGYYSYLSKKLFKYNIFKSTLKSIVTFILGYFLFSLFFIIIMILVVIISKLIGYNLVS